MKQLTIVIPSYNTEAFIDKNMKTFLDPRLYDKVEILLINDGSKDRTAELAAAYERDYPDYVRLINKENGGHGSVINRGIREAQGRYFKVIDADDWVDTEQLVRLVGDLEGSEADLVVNPNVTVNQQTGREKLCEYRQIADIGAQGPFEEVLRRGVGITLHSVTFKTSILQDNGITVTERCFYEDFQYVLYPIPYIRTVTVLDYPVYRYLVGQKTQSVDAANALKNVEMYYKVFRDTVEHYNSLRNGFSETVDKYFRDRVCIFLRSLYNIYLRNGEKKGAMESFREMDARIGADAPEFYRLVGEKNGYIRQLRSKGQFTFSVMTKLFKLRKVLLGMEA